MPRNIFLVKSFIRFTISIVINFDAFYFQELDDSMDSNSTYHSFESYCKQ